MGELGLKENNLIKNLEQVDEKCLTLPEAYESLLRVLKRYMVMSEDDYMKAALWIIGTAWHKDFISYPYMFLNAMKGSGKSRFLKLAAFLIGGKHVSSLTEAVAFRFNKPLCVDEAENLGRKEKAFLREILNSAYKRGVNILRVRKEEKTGDMKIDEFDPYRPICLANIDGLDDVLEDRCLTIILEKSFDQVITRRLELFEFDQDAVNISQYIREGSVVSVVNVGCAVKKTCIEIMNFLNNYQSSQTTLTTLTTTTTLTTLTTPPSEITLDILEALDAAPSLNGRDIELWLPLLIVARSISKDILDNALAVAIKSGQDRMDNTVLENPDVALIAHLYSFMERSGEWVAVTDIVSDYILHNPDDKWFNAKWVGRAIKRNRLAKMKRRLSRGMEIILDKDKIAERAGKFGIASKIGDYTKSGNEAKK